jgi:hypothetical protein
MSLRNFLAKRQPFCSSSEEPVGLKSQEATDNFKSYLLKGQSSEILILFLNI